MLRTTRLSASSVLGSALLAAGAGTTWATTPSVTLMGDLPGGTVRSHGLGMSSDGMVGTGYSYVAPSGVVFEAFRWRSDLGMVSIGDLPGGSVLASGSDVSADGTVIVGGSRSGSGDQAFRWTEAGGMVGLGDLAGGAFFSDASAVSSDGSIVVGYSRSTAADRREAFRWTQATGMVALGDLAGGSFASEAYDISGNGLVIVGYGTASVGSDQAARWTSGTGWVALGDLPTGALRSVARATNTDGSIVVGQGSVTDGYEAFIWTQAGGMVSLGDLPGSTVQGDAWDLSADGSVIVGTGRGENDGGQVVIWTEATGMVPLPLASTIKNIVGINLKQNITGTPSISTDGRVIVATTVDFLWDPATSTYESADLACRILLPGPGACCIGSTCTDNVDPLQCSLACGVFISDEDTCASIACGDFGACCFKCGHGSVAPCPTTENYVSTRCVVMLEADCIAADGVYVGGDCTCGVPCDCLGDLSGDMITDVTDFNIMALGFGSGNPDCATHAEGDMNCDGIIDVADFNILASSYGCGN